MIQPGLFNWQSKNTFPLCLLAHRQQSDKVSVIDKSITVDDFLAQKLDNIDPLVFTHSHL